LIRHADDARVRRLTRFAELLVAGMRREMVQARQALTVMAGSGNAEGGNKFKEFEEETSTK
jgi:hypothetical protein